ncbi:hypothetical protein [Brevundimonas sp. Root1423]|uniref:hypothetical protein n=1 Tax=Brevundimonas sp. Root1423 TaxID=1736462 RepID=UPI0006F9C034|nr:hypothetical protein [Brevundimonas sp. Root1423]KQY90120.1 hypothetical protein ASD25_20695 [Brevundimonas sp. Root1423]KRA22943.1 hypothetical protein ASD59_10015 [Brevundimonas sp. Root608]
MRRQRIGVNDHVVIEEKRALISNCLFVTAGAALVLGLATGLPFWPVFLVGMVLQIGAIWVRASS